MNIEQMRLPLQQRPKAGCVANKKRKVAYIPVSVAFPVYPSNNWVYQSRHCNRIPCKVTQQTYREKEQPQNLLETILGKKTMSEPQSNLKETDNPSILKLILLQEKDQSTFTSVFPVLKLTSHFLPQSSVSRRSDSNPEVQKHTLIVAQIRSLITLRSYILILQVT